MNDIRSYVRQLAAYYTNAGEPTAWFERLYAEAMAGNATIPWADLKANPNLVQWLDNSQIQGAGKNGIEMFLCSL